MTLRLVLVSLVAGLGVGIPSPADIEGWVASSRSWASVCLAELGAEGIGAGFLVSADNSRRAEATSPTDPASLNPSPSTGTLTAAPASPEETPTPSFEPIEVDERLYVGLAYDLNHLGEGLGMLPRVAAPVASSPSTVRPDELVELAINRHGATVNRLIGQLGRKLNAVAAREIADKNFVAMESASDLYFARPEETQVVEMAAPAPEPSAAEVAFAAMEQSEALYFADDERAEFPAPDSNLAVAIELPDLPDNPFAPDESQVEALTQEVASVSTPSRRGAVNRAVRLTSQAMAAWASVLSETTIASVSTSSKIR